MLQGGSSASVKSMALTVMHKRSLISGCFVIFFALQILWAPMRAGCEEKPWVSFSKVMAELSQNQKFVDALIDRLGTNPRAGGILGPEEIKKLREDILGKNFEALDRFPTMTVTGMGRAVSLAAAVAKPEKKDQDDQAGNPLDALPAEEELQIPTGGEPPDPTNFIKHLGFDLDVGDLIDSELASQYADGERLSWVLNRLAMDPLKNKGEPKYRIRAQTGYVDSPEGLVAYLMASGHEIEIRDARYFANFGDLLYKGQDVLTPFWVDTQIRVPKTDRTLTIPVAHSQHELRINGPQVNTILSFYFGIDGKAAFRSMATRDQTWVMGHVARTYKGNDALEVVRLSGAIIRTYETVKRDHPDLPFGGYFNLGVCNDVNAMIELHMQGETSLYPLTLDAGFFPGAGEVERLAQRLPVDGRDRAEPDFRRIRGSLPVAELSQLPFDDLRHDIQLVETAWLNGQMELMDTRVKRLRVIASVLIAAALIWVPWWLWVAFGSFLILGLLFLIRRLTRRKLRQELEHRVKRDKNQ